MSFRLIPNIILCHFEQREKSLRYSTQIPPCGRDDKMQKLSKSFSSCQSKHQPMSFRLIPNIILCHFEQREKSLRYSTQIPPCGRDDKMQKLSKSFSSCQSKHQPMSFRLIPNIILCHSDRREESLSPTIHPLRQAHSNQG